MVRHFKRRQLAVRRRRTRKVVAAFVVALVSFAITVAACDTGPSPGVVDDSSVERVIQSVASDGDGQVDPATAQVLQEASIQTTHQPVCVSDQATSELERLRVEPKSVLARAGYLDMFGSVWSCTVAGDGWVEIVVLSDGGEGGCKRQCVRMEREQWERIMRASA